MRREVSAGIITLLLIMHTSQAMAADLNIDLGEFSITNPKIIADYSQPVRVTNAWLTYGTQTYALCAKPDPATFSKHYELYPVQGGGTPGTCTGTMQPLKSGKYELTIAAEDSAGQSSQANPPDRRTFTIIGLEITMTEPPHGLGSKRPIPIKLLTHEMIDGKDYNRSATCRWTDATALMDPKGFTTAFDTMRAFATTGGSEHRVDFPAKGTMQVLCREPSGRLSYANFSIDFDASAPRFLNFSVRPPLVNDPGRKTAAIAFQTDDNSTCTYQQTAPTSTNATPFPRDNAKDPEPAGSPFENENESITFIQDHEALLSYQNIMDELEHNFTYRVTCKNRAGLTNTTIAKVVVRIGGDVQILAPAAGLLNRSVFPARVRTTFEPQQCTVNGLAMQQEDEDLNFSREMNLTDGRHTLEVRCTTTNKTSTVTRDVRIDATPPTGAQILTSNVSCDGTIAARFVAQDPLARGPDGRAVQNSEPTGIRHYNYTVTNDAGWLISRNTTNGSVVLDAPTPLGDHLVWTVFAIDEAGNAGPVNTTTVADLHRGDDEECGRPPFIQLTKPSPLGFTNTQDERYTFEIQTLRQSTCNYRADITADTWSPQISFGQTNGLVHSSQVSYTKRRILVNCTEAGGDRRVHERIFTIGRDPTRPQIGLEVKPSANIYDRASNQPTLTITTDDPTYCTIDGAQVGDLNASDVRAYTQSHMTVLDYSAEQSGIKELVVECRNLAQLRNNATQFIVIDYNRTINITVLSPPAFTANATILLRISPNKQSQCQYRANDSQEWRDFADITDGVHSAALGTLSEGTHNYPVTCQSIAEGETGSMNVGFTVLRNPPTITSIEGRTIICSNAASAVFNITVGGIDQSPSINYSISFGNNTTNNTSSAKVISIDVAELGRGKHTLSAIAINRAGVAGARASYDFDVLNSSAAACREGETCQNGRKDTGEDNIDCGGVCANQCVACVSATDCASPQVCRENVCVAPAQSCSGGCPTGKVCRDNACISAPACETDTDCPGQVCRYGACTARPTAPSCSTHTDCDTGYLCMLSYCIKPTSSVSCTNNSACDANSVCFGGVCTAAPPPVPLCNNGIKDGNEAGIDCGGSCDTCVSCTNDAACTGAGKCIGQVCVNPGTHATCTDNTDCPGQTCEKSVCIGHTVEFCDDGVKDNGEEDIDCGGTCAACTTCESDEECDGKVCSDNGICIPPARASCDDDVQNGDETGTDCGGRCAACETGGGPVDPVDPPIDIPTDPSDPSEPVPEESHLLSIVLIAVGIAIMGGSGYFLYEQNESKKAAAAAAARQQYAAQAARRPDTRTDALRPMNPELAAKYAQEQAAREAALREAYRQREAQKEAQRKALFEKFGNAQTAQPTTQPSAQAAASDKTTIAAPQQKPSAERHAEAPKDTPAASKRDAKSDDAFDELDKIGK